MTLLGTPFRAARIDSVVEPPASMSLLEVRGLSKTYTTAHGSVQASRGLTFSLAPGEVLSLVGPSGCGKTTALRSIAGLEEPDEGHIRIGKEVVFDSEQGLDVPTHRRPIGVVFQSYAVWPHMTVFDTVAYPLVAGRKRVPKDEVTRRVNEALRQVRISELSDRGVTKLSGGQQQRVAIARCLVRDADLLLFDEPLSNLDAKLRDEMRGELRELFDATGVSVLYVTHDLGEALALSDRLLVLEHGRIVQEGPPEEIYFSPRTTFVARFMGNSTVLPGDATDLGDQVVVHSAVGAFMTAHDTMPQGVAAGPLNILVRPEFVALLPAISPEERGRTEWRDDTNGVLARVDTMLFLGGVIEYRLRLQDGSQLIARRPAHHQRYVPGAWVRIDLDPRGITLLPPEEVEEPAAVAAAS